MNIRDEINRWIDRAEVRGMTSYGVSLEENNDGRDWSVELIEELVDALQYAAKDILEKEKYIQVLERRIIELEDRLATPFD